MSDSTTTAPTAAEIVEIIGQLEQYRDRLIADTTEVAKKAKMSKTVVMQQLEPELQEIDKRLEALHQLQAQTATPGA
jgi:hypothetical protein